MPYDSLSKRPTVRSWKRRPFSYMLGTTLPLIGCNVGVDRAPPDAVEYAIVSEHVFTAEFSTVLGVRELSDGRALVADGLEETIRLIDPTSSNAPRIGVVGEGPGEFRRGPGRLFALRNDTTAAAEQAGNPLVFMHQDRMLRLGARSSGPLIGADTVGDRWVVMALSGGPAPIGSDGRRRFAYMRTIVRTTRQFEVLDTITTISGGEVVRTPPRGDRRGTLTTDRHPEEAIGFGDGWIAVAHLAPYRVDWMKPSGDWVRGPALAQDSTPFERTDYGTIIDASDGRLLIRRSMRDSVESNTVRYDVVDRSGRLNGYFFVAPNEYVVGSGTQRLYIVTEDHFDIKRIRTVHWPPSAIVETAR